MSLKNPKDFMLKAQKNKLGVCSFNVNNFETMRAVLKAAQKTKTPVILQTSNSTATNYATPEYFAMCAKILEKEFKVDFALHLDHGANFEICKKCINAGYTSVMIDASSLPFEKNVSLTKKVASLAHKNNVWCEGELGQMLGEEDNVKSEDELFTNPQKAQEFVQKAGVDALAISVGTSHGIFKVPRKDGLRHDIISQIHALCPKTILVLHGSSLIDQNVVKAINKLGGQITKTSGTNLQEIVKAISNGITKINMDSDLRLAYTFGVRNLLTQNPKVFDIRSQTNAGCAEMEKSCIERLTMLCKK